MVKTGESIDGQSYFYSEATSYCLSQCFIHRQVCFIFHSPSGVLHTRLASASFLLIESVAFAPDGIDNFGVWVDCEKFFTNTVDVNGDG